MRSTFHSIETAKRALFAQQTALATTGHNVANANTEGYTRQRADMIASRPIEAYGMTHSTAKGQIGTGVEVESITRIREKFLDDQIRNEYKSLGQWTIQSDTLSKLEAIMNEPSDTGLRSVMDKFWNAWSDLSKDPESATGHKIVREAAISLMDALNHMSKQLDDLSSDLTTNINVKAADMQSKLNSVAELNREIARLEGMGDNANDLRDQRDLLVDRLSKIVNVRVTELDNGYSITMGGTPLVEGQQAAEITGDMLRDSFDTDLTSGEVYGTLVSQNRYLAEYRNQLDTLANTIANGEFSVTLPKGSILPEGTVLNGVTYTGTNRELAADTVVTVKGINGLHKLGYTLNGEVGQDLFVAKAGITEITAASIMLNQNIADDPGKIATSMRTITGAGGETAVVGNNTLASLIADLKNTKFDFSSSTNNNGVASSATVDDYFRSIIGQLGVQAQEASRQADNSQLIVDQVESRRQSVSGVSLDEEMSDLIKFQHAYSAASRFMTTYDQLLDKLINSTGVVGR